MPPLPEGSSNPVPDHRSSRTRNFDYQLEDEKIYIRTRIPANPKAFIRGDLVSTAGLPDALEWKLFDGIGVPYDKHMQSMLAPNEQIVEISVASEIVVAVSNLDRVYLFKPTEKTRPTCWENRLGAPDFLSNELFLPHDRRGWAFSCSVHTKPEIRTTEFMHPKEIVDYFSDAKGDHFVFGFTPTIYVVSQDGDKVFYIDSGLAPSFSRAFLVPAGTQAQSISAAGSTVFLSTIDSEGKLHFFTRMIDYEINGACPGLEVTYLNTLAVEPPTGQNGSYPLGFGVRKLPLQGWIEHSVDAILPNITHNVCIRLIGQGDEARILRIQGKHPKKGWGYYFKKIVDTDWHFHTEPAVGPVGAVFPFNPAFTNTLLSYTEKRYHPGIFHHDKKVLKISVELENFHPFLTDAEPFTLIMKHPDEPPQSLRIHAVDAWNLQSNRKHDEDLIGTLDGEPKALVGTLLLTQEQIDFAQNGQSRLGDYLKSHILDYHGETKAVSIIADNSMVILKLGDTEYYFERTVSEEEIDHSFYMRKANDKKLVIDPGSPEECRDLIAINKRCLKEIKSIFSDRRINNMEYMLLDVGATALRPIVSKVFDVVRPEDPTYQKAARDLALLFETHRRALWHSVQRKSPALGYEKAMAILNARITDRKNDLEKMMSESHQKKINSLSISTIKGIAQLPQHEHFPGIVSHNEALSEKNTLFIRTSLIRKKFSALLQVLENNHERLVKKYSGSDVDPIVKISEQLISTLAKATDRLDLAKDNGSAFYDYCSDSIDEAKLHFNQQRASWFIRLLTILRQAIANLVRVDEKKHGFFDGTTITTQSAEILYAFNVGLEHLEEEDNNRRTVPDC